jgi:hypothetical protein
MTLRKLCIALTCVLVAGCGGSPRTPEAPNADTITGTERFGWDQPAADAGEVASFRYAMYVDDVRSEAADVSCSPGPASGRFACTARLPQMAAGVHTIQVASFVLDGATIRESPRSAPVGVTKR